MKINKIEAEILGISSKRSELKELCNEFNMRGIEIASDKITANFQGYKIELEIDEIKKGSSVVVVTGVNLRQDETRRTRGAVWAGLRHTMLNDYLYNKTRKRAVGAIDGELLDRLNQGTKENNESFNELQDRAKKVKLSDEVIKTLNSVYTTMSDSGKKAINRFLQYLNFEIGSPVMNLLARMIEEVPLSTYQDFKDVGFYTEAARRGNLDDLFSLKAACGLKQAELDVKQLFKNNRFKERNEIENIVSYELREKKNKRKK